ncbi:hypothetical protein KAI58_05120 [Candidatus Gracilibacteria bacterium]|nr:hypothetical protein [Candidatus Gracilibacteria bacterium]
MKISTVETHSKKSANEINMNQINLVATLSNLLTCEWEYVEEIQYSIRKIISDIERVSNGMLSTTENVREGIAARIDRIHRENKENKENKEI